MHLRISILYSLLFMIMLSCIKKDPKRKIIPPYTGPVSSVDNIETLYSDSAALKIKLNAKKQLEYLSGDRYFPQGIKIEFFETEQTPSSVLTSNKAKFNKAKNLYTATGDVVIRNLLEKKKLNTEELHWNPVTRKIFTDKFVRIETPEEILMGEGLESDQDFNRYKILNIRGTITLDNGVD